MKREHLTRELSEPELLEELRHLVSYFEARGISDASVLLGFAWGNDYYPCNEWNAEILPLKELEAVVVRVEADGMGRLGGDDLFVKVEDVEFQFCHHSDLHLGFDVPSDTSEHFFQRWAANGYEPAEWLKSETYGPGRKVRAAGG